MTTGIVGILPDVANADDWTRQRDRFASMTPAEARREADRRNAAARQEREQRDRKHQEQMAAARRPVAAAQNTVSQKDRTDAARRAVLEGVIAGDRSMLDHLRHDAAWFPASTSYPYRSADRAPATDAEIVAAARQLLPSYGGASATRTPAPTRTAVTPTDHTESWKRAAAAAAAELDAERRMKARSVHSNY